MVRIMPRKESWGTKLEGFFMRAWRLIKSSTKPSSREFWLVFKIVLVLIVALGLLGFGIRIIAQAIVRPG